MGKQGPCYHCGITSTPLWRNGPPEKPILCNACGSRWRTKGSLANYIPIHARMDVVKPEDSKIFKPKTIFSKRGPKSKKSENLEASVEASGELTSQTDQNFKQILEEELSTRSSTNSAVSYSESCAYICNVDASDMIGTAQSVVWDTLVPSKKRTCSRKPSSVEKLAKDLCNVLQEQQLSSQFSSPSEEDLLFESGSPLDTFEIGHGGCLIKYINSNFQEESDASSSVYSKSQTHIGSQDLANLQRKGINAPFVEDRKVKKLNFEAGQNSMRRDNLPEEKLAVLSSRSALVSVDLRVIVNHEEFLRHLNYEEQHQLMKHLPSSDVDNLPSSLKSMFESRQFLETLSSFQQLLREGIFEMPCMGIANTKYRILRRLLLSSFAKSKWIEHYQQNKDAERKKTDYSVQKLPISACHNQDHDFTEPRPQFSCGNKRAINAETEASYVRKRNIIPFPNDGRSNRMGSFQFSDESSKKDILVGILSNASTPGAKLLICHQSKMLSINGTEASTSHDVPSNESSSTLTSHAMSTSMTKHPHNPKTKSMQSLPTHL